jgi:hypothetical protein
MEKLDLRKTYAHLYKASAKKPSLVEVPAMNFLMVDGQGDPNTSPEFQSAIDSLYGLSYTLKFGFKMRKGIDWTVMTLEGLWWTDESERLAAMTADDEIAAFLAASKGAWKWTLAVMQPDVVTPAALGEAREELQRRHPEKAGLERVRLERFEEGPAAQVLHVGPYTDVGPTTQRLLAFVRENGCAPTGRHHEIYLSDPRRTAPEKLKTILRHPVRRA